MERSLFKTRGSENFCLSPERRWVPQKMFSLWRNRALTWIIFLSPSLQPCREYSFQISSPLPELTTQQPEFDIICILCHLDCKQCEYWMCYEDCLPDSTSLSRQWFQFLSCLLMLFSYAYVRLHKILLFDFSFNFPHLESSVLSTFTFISWFWEVISTIFLQKIRDFPSIDVTKSFTNGSKQS